MAAGSRVSREGVCVGAREYTNVYIFNNQSINSINISGLYLARASRAKLVGIGSRRPLCGWRRSSPGLLMALGKILLGRWTADIYLEDCLIRSTGVDNEDCA